MKTKANNGARENGRGKRDDRGGDGFFFTLAPEGSVGTQRWSGGNASTAIPAGLAPISPLAGEMSPLGVTERGNLEPVANNPSLSSAPTHRIKSEGRPSLPQGERSSGAAEPSTYFRYNSLDEMTVGRPEEPVSGIKPVKRAKIGLGSDEGKGDVRRAGKRTGKTGRPGR